ncbi:fungal pheromone STE3G-protein-coupled receptor [Meira miltonrushii]|uniref:Fungal pheromone STE3G-protein-coupled receptor n=1 Tax=Meira miltonrushii TaxID=1280837 RepID=A0A316VAS8_9BASI|nr:fungal pheromone STE3G-protein-coupled receptor [Meira miltonrushii]PWN33303.1 fungal pheromone STE3G-protein-coupled receptor [Meira miltonrushii]
MGVPCASLCVAKKLEAIASTRIVSVSAKEKRRTLIIDLFISIFIPIVYSTLSIVYQGHRFDIIEGIGCNPATYVSWPYILLGIIPPPIISAISLVYSCMCLKHFVVRRKQFTAVLCSAGSDLNKSRYLRMMALCSAEMLIDLPLWIIQQGLASEQYARTYEPYQSWSYVHYGFGTVLSIPSTIFDLPDAHKAWISSEMSRWTAPVSGWMVIL